ncbi:MAG: urease accessory protein UreE [Spirulina sp.]
MLTVTQILPADSTATVVAELALTAHDRTRSRHRFEATDGTPIQLNLPRGSLLRGNTLLASPDGQLVRVLAKPEPVLKVIAESPLALVRAAYHLGNRHVPLEISLDSLVLEPDPVLEAMLLQLGGLSVQTLIQPFEPEAGAYHSGHGHTAAPAQSASSAHAHPDSQPDSPHAHPHAHGP